MGSLEMEEAGCKSTGKGMKMEEITPQQFLENLKGWKPDGQLREKIAERLRQARVEVKFQEEISRALHDSSESSFRYIQYVNELAATRRLDGQNLASQVARLVGLVEALRESGRKYQEVFGRYDESTRGGLTRDHFDTVYFDAIQGIDIRELLKNIFDEAGPVLKALALAAAGLNGVSCQGLYEHGIRFQLFLRYFLAPKRFTPEEIWSILFDLSNQISEILKKEEGPTETELEDLEDKVRKYKKN
jgi:hypothetical protein